MSNQYSVEKLKVGEIYGDFEITKLCRVKERSGKNQIMYEVTCTICGRSKLLRKSFIVKNQRVSHRSCTELIRPKDELYYRLRSVHEGMRTRTTNEKQYSHKNYKHVSSDYYKYFVDFYDDLFESFVEHLENHDSTTLDRINPYGNYEKGNVRWATREEQNQPENKRLNYVNIGIDSLGEEHKFFNARKFSELHGLNTYSVRACLRGEQKSHQGWTFTRIYL